MAWNLLLTSDFGLLSLFVIVFILIMAVYFSWFFKKKIEESEKEAGK